MRAPDGAAFYFDDASGMTMWATADDWQWRADPSGRWFMHNRVTGVTRWPGPDMPAARSPPRLARRHWGVEEAWSVGEAAGGDWECVDDDRLSAAPSTVAASSAASSASARAGARSMGTGPMSVLSSGSHDVTPRVPRLRADAHERGHARARPDGGGGVDVGAAGEGWARRHAPSGTDLLYTPRVDLADDPAGVFPGRRGLGRTDITPARSPADSSCGSTPSGVSGALDSSGLWGNAAVDAAVDVVAGSLLNLCSCSRVADTFSHAGRRRAEGVDAVDAPREYATARARRRAAGGHAEHMPDDESWDAPAGAAAPPSGAPRAPEDAAAEAALAALASVSAGVTMASRVTGQVVTAGLQRLSVAWSPSPQALLLPLARPQLDAAPCLDDTCTSFHTAAEPDERPLVDGTAPALLTPRLPFPTALDGASVGLAGGAEQHFIVRSSDAARQAPEWQVADRVDATSGCAHMASPADSSATSASFHSPAAGTPTVAVPWTGLLSAMATSAAALAADATERALSLDAAWAMGPAADEGTPVGSSLAGRALDAVV
jgi:hypothetical protein